MKYINLLNYEKKPIFWVKYIYETLQNELKSNTKLTKRLIGALNLEKITKASWEPSQNHDPI